MLSSWFIREGRVNGRQRGTTLIELLVGLTVGAIVLMGVIFSWGLSVRNNAYVLAVTALNNDMRSLMQIVTQDIRRAVPDPANEVIYIEGSGLSTCVTFLTTFARADGADEGPPRPSGYRVTTDDDGRASFQMWRAGSPATTPDCIEADGWEILLEDGDRGIFIDSFDVVTAESRCLNKCDPTVTVSPGRCVAVDPSNDATRANVEQLLVGVRLLGRTEVAGGTRQFDISDAVKIRADRVMDPTFQCPTT